MNELALEMRELLTKHHLKADALHNEFDVETLTLMGNGCIALHGLINCEYEILESIEVKMIALDDMETITYNLWAITSSINFKKLQLRTFCFN